ncbi:hypothetical protein [Streptomyces sp. NBC_00091]|uniref:hypothetical protein n=1 Tax=Streptomyces sp. NBC_00091 TaxID=2975648 RepID=UPI00225B2F0C|nr:hypothetical protein [Streptomyces sp. NBC_00091]MCX5376214.1 hypothetical protein [Streptomyces sp. NBC_00091]
MTFILAAHSDRLERLRAQLAGTARSDSRMERRLRLSPQTGFLYGMTLRAAARLEQDQKLTDLEENLIGLLRLSGSSDSEIAEFGHLYRDNLTARGTGEIFPAAVTGRPLTEGYSYEDLAAELPALAPELTSQPTFRTVRADALGPDEGIDTEEAAAARFEYGGGSIVVLADGDIGPWATNPTPLDVRVEYNKFYAVRVGDQGGGRSEIYWASGAGSDTAAYPDFKSREYGATSSGDTKYFDSGSYVFRGTIKNTLMCNIQCWEADDSDGGFYNRLREALRDISRWCYDKSEKLIDQNEDYNASSAFLSLVALISDLINLILGWLINEDDLFGEVDIAYSSRGLYEMSRRSVDHNRVNFSGRNGSNSVDLYMKVVMPQGPVFPPEPLKLRTLNNGSWSSATELPNSLSRTAPAVEAFQDKLHVTFIRGGGTQLLWTSSENASSWTTPTQIRGFGGYLRPALCPVDANTLLGVHVGGAGELWWSTYDGSTWSAHQRVKNYVATAGAALTWHDGRIYLVHRGQDQAMHVNSYANGQWSDSTVLSSFAGMFKPTTPSAPTAVSYKGVLHVVYRASDNSLGWFRLQNGSWTPSSVASHWRTTAGPAIEVSDNRMYCLHVGTGGRLYSASYDGTAWSGATQIGGPVATDDPVLQTYQGKLRLMYR